MRRRSRLHRLLVLALGAASGLHADGLADLKAALARLPGTEPVKGVLELRTTRQTTEDRKPVITRGHASARVEDGPQGLRMAFARDDLQKASAEARAQARDPERTSPHRAGLREADPLDAAELLNHADALARYLDKATLLEERREPWNGRPARVLVIKVDPPLPQSQRRHLKKLEVNARVWLSEDGAPLALSYQALYSGSRFFITFKGSIQEERRFAVAGDRLLVLTRSVEETASGFGVSYTNQRTATFMPDR
jgi:hypothetical protein